MTLCDLHAQESARWATSLQDVCSAFTPQETVGSRLAGARPGGEAIELVRAQRRLIRDACAAGRGCGAAVKEVKEERS